jgi:thioredoxin 1
MKAVEVTEENFDQIAAADLVLLDFGAPWCSPCVRLSPIIDRMAQQYDGQITVGKVNVDQQESLMRRFDIRTLPTLCYLRDGELVETQTNSFTESDIQKRIEALLNSQRNWRR